MGASPVSDRCCPLPALRGCRIAPCRTFRVARLEALLSLQPGAENRRQALDQLGHELAAEITWVDPRNACLSLAVGPSAMAVQVLLELRGPDQLGLMVNSREGMGSGAPLSHAVLEQLLELLMRLLPGAALAYRSDRDGPIRQGSGQRNQT
jgi:hypothetical protein